jgi:nickel-dependent lactate racemase
MLLSCKGLLDGYLTDSETYFLLQAGLDQVDLEGKRVLVLIPDHTRSCPLPMLFKAIVDLVAPRTAKLDFLIALGTHQPLSDEKIDKMLGLDAGERETTYRHIGVYNHMWSDPGTFKNFGTIPARRIREITHGLMDQDVPVGLNKMILDYDQLIILGPTFPHEVVGFSGGLKYLFPGIADWQIINFFHWLGAVITCIKIIGNAETPVRQVINEAAEFVPRPILNIDLVVRDGRLAGCFVGEPKEAWAEAADLSDKLHIVYKDRPFKFVLGIAPEMYDDVWTAGKVMYKLEPIVADGGELVIYAPHVTEISYTHGQHLDRIGYHVRDYFLKQMDKFRDIPAGVMAHSTHVRGLGSFENGVERPRITVTLATGIPRDRVEKVALNYRDPKTIDIDAYRNREHDGILVVDHAGEILHRLNNSTT